MNLPRKLLLLIPFLAAGAVLAQAQRGSPPKQTIMVAMRDGVKLATDVYLPPGDGPFPVVLMRNPYNKSAPPRAKQKAKQQNEHNERGYALVHQDTRGRYASEGKNLPFIGDDGAEHQDGQDTLRWIAKQPWCNGEIGTWGGSALGMTQLFLADTDAPELKCQFIIVGAPSMYHDFVYPGGIFKKNLAETWLSTQKFAPEARKIWGSHPSYDEYWRARDLRGRYAKVNVPAVHLGGYYDMFAQGTIDSFIGYQTEGGPRARGKQKLLMGPWTHAVLIPYSGVLKFDNAGAPPNNIHDAWRWFEHHLKGAKNGIDKVPAVTYFVMGDVTDPKASGKEWRTAGQWPPVKTTATPFYLNPDRILSREKPAKDGELT